MSEAILVVGATSGIGRAVARRAAQEGARLVLAARDVDELERVAADCRVRHGGQVSVLPFDALDFDAHDELVTRASEAFEGGLDGAILCHGQQFEQADAQADPELARRMCDVNYSSVASLFERLARGLESRGRGFLCAVSSVAGDRGRASNYLYGASKAALSTYLDGLRARLARRGVDVICVRPGFVDTRLTYAHAGVPFAAAPERVARDIWRGIHKGRRVVYTPPFWRWIMLAIRSIPDVLFKRLPL